MYLLPFHHPNELPSGGAAWKFFIACDDSRGETSAFFDAMDALGEARSADFDAMLRHLTKLAATGKPWEVLIPDKKRMHDVGVIGYTDSAGQHHQDKVWEFKHGDLRILWCYGGKGKIILFGHTLVKDQKKIDPADVKIVEKLNQKYVLAYETGQIEIAGGAENERAFASLFPKSKAGPKLSKKAAPSRSRR